MMTRKKHSILVVDDEQNMRVALYETLIRTGYEVAVAENGRMALAILEKSPPDLVITDIKMPEMDGIAFLKELRQRGSQVPVLIITGFATVSTALEAMKQGAVDYILKPFPAEVIEAAVARVFASDDEKVPEVCERYLKVRQRQTERPIIGSDPKMMMVLEKTRKVASSKATVLILGESGTGKEVLARYLHQCSNRNQAAFVALNCAALPEGLLESELFGHEKGAFTGAITAKKGKFELADGGTLLLDEIGEIPLHLQAKLLRVLQEEEVDRLGGREPVKVDVHVLATTNRSLIEMVEEGTFRQDLYYRLNVIPLLLPPLRERKGDILTLAEFFIEKYSTIYNLPPKKLSPAAATRFLNHDWPGNVREMENFIERAVLLGSSEQFVAADFWEDEEISTDPDAETPAAASVLSPSSASEDSENESFFDPATTTLREAERQMILHALEKTDNNRTHAAKMLGVSVRTLRNKLQEYRGQGFIS